MNKFWDNSKCPERHKYSQPAPLLNFSKQFTVYGKDTRQNHWTTKYRSLTTYTVWGQCLCHTDPLVQTNMMFIHQIAFKILSKISDTKYRSPTYIYFMKSILVSYWSIIIHSSIRLTDIRQNHRTMKYRSLTHIYFMQPIFVSHWSIILHTTFLYQTVFKILRNITGTQNIDHWPIYILWGQSLCHTDPLSQVWSSSNSFQDIRQNHWTMKYRSLTYIHFMRSIFVSHWSIIPSMTFIHQIVFKILGKISDLHK